MEPVRGGMLDNIKTFTHFNEEKQKIIDDCIACGQCESVCPQHLPIIKLMKEASEILD